MKIRLRLTLLLGCLLLIFGGFAWAIRSAHENETTAMFANLRNERQELLDRLLKLTGQSLRSFCTDYARWDEMVRFTETEDPAWAEINLAQSLANFSAQAAWVLDASGRPIYHTVAPGLSDIRALPPALLAQFNQAAPQEMRHFFWASPAGLLEVRSAPIVPSDFLTHPSATRGWWLVARLWDDAHLRRLGEIIQGELHLGSETPRETQPAAIHLRHALPDWTGAPLSYLHVNYRPAALASLLDTNVTESYLFYGFGLALLLLTVIALSRWVVVPLRRLEASLASGRSSALHELREQQHEFGHLARLVEQSFTQRDTLQREIVERQRAEEGLRQSRDLHNRLARDLHDGAIQSIYAAGLGLENMRSLLRTDPAAAEQKLDACLRSFNQTIAAIRGFIYGLESGTEQSTPLEQSLRSMVQTMRALQPVPIQLTVDNRLPGRLTDAQEIHLLQMLRESLSNALRHSGARAITIEFSGTPAGQVRLVVSDDGCSFDPAEKTKQGHGLANLATRARELAGELQIESSPGKGTRLTITFTHSAPP